MAERVSAVFETHDEVLDALELLTETGIDSEAVTVCSSEPAHHFGLLAGRDRKSHIRLWALAGGVLGAMAGYVLTSLTARAMNLPTGGQPIVSLWAFGFVTFELTALGAMAGTVISLLYEAGLPRWKGRLYDRDGAEAFAAGHWLLQIDFDGPDRAERVKSALQKSGATGIRDI